MRRNRQAVLIVFLIVAALTTSSVSTWAAATAKENKGPVLVGRISYVDGDLLRYVPEEDDWVLTVKDAPFGLNDALYSSEGAKAEFILPNQVWIRAGGLTQIQLIEVREDVTEVDVASGVTRFYNKSRDGVIKATTPFGYVVAEGDTIFDLYVGDESVEVVPVEGTVDFIHADGGSKYEVAEGSTSLLADAKTVTSGEANVDADWDDWSNDRDKFWARRLEVKGDSAEYVPEQLEDSYADLDESGRWERVEYQGENRMMWRPTNVPEGWAPFTNGRWTEYYGDQCWVPDEPFGYVTHHYGNWIRNDACGCWYWAPPVRRVAVVRTAPVYSDCECGWYPGRVGWFHSGTDVAWVPLAPAEPYYTSHWWGPGVVVGAGVGVGIGIGAYAWINHAVVVPTVSLYSVRSYWGVRVTSFHRETFVRTFHHTRIIDRTIIRDTRIYRDRYRYTDRRSDRFPHHDVTRRIHHNRDISRRDRDISRRSIERDVRNVRHGDFDRTRRVDNPRTRDRFVDRADMKNPQRDRTGPQRDLKRNTRNVRENPDRNVGKDRTGRDGRGERGVGRDGRGRTGRQELGVEPGDRRGPRSPRDGAQRPGREGREGREGAQRPGREGREGREGAQRPGREGREGREGVQRPGREGRQELGVEPGDRRGPRSPRDGAQRPGREGREGREGAQRPGREGREGREGVQRPGREGRQELGVEPGDRRGPRSPRDGAQRPGREGREGREGVQRPGRESRPTREGVQGSGREGRPTREGVQRPGRESRPTREGVQGSGREGRPTREGVQRPGRESRPTREGVQGSGREGRPTREGVQRPGRESRPTREGVQGSGREGRSTREGAQRPGREGREGREGAQRPGRESRPAREGVQQQRPQRQERVQQPQQQQRPQRQERAQQPRQEQRPQRQERVQQPQQQQRPQRQERAQQPRQERPQRQERVQQQKPQQQQGGKKGGKHDKDKDKN